MTMVVTGVVHRRVLGFSDEWVGQVVMVLVVTLSVGLGFLVGRTLVVVFIVLCDGVLCSYLYESG